MTPTIKKEQVKKLVGQTIYAIRKDGTMTTGKLVRIKGNALHICPTNGKKAQTKAIIPLVLFDLLAIGTSPFAYGAYGYPGYGGYGGLGGYGYPGFFW